MPDAENELEMLAPFGIFADTGKPLNEISEETIQSFADAGPIVSAEESALLDKAGSGPHYGVDADTDPSKLAEAGWAVLFAPGVDQRIKDALQPLLDHRKSQVGDENLFKVLGFLCAVQISELVPLTASMTQDELSERLNCVRLTD